MVAIKRRKGSNLVIGFRGGRQASRGFLDESLFALPHKAIQLCMLVVRSPHFISQYPPPRHLFVSFLENPLSIEMLIEATQCVSRGELGCYISG